MHKEPVKAAAVAKAPAGAAAAASAGSGAASANSASANQVQSSVIGNNNNNVTVNFATQSADPIQLAVSLKNVEINPSIVVNTTTTGDITNNPAPVAT